MSEEQILASIPFDIHINISDWSCSPFTRSEHQ